MLAQAVGRFGAEVEHLSPAAQNKELADFVRFIGKPGIWFDKFCVVRLVKAVDGKRLRIASHEVVAQLMRQRNGQRGNARGVEVKLRAVLHPSVDRSRIRRFADRVHVPAKRRREIAHTIPVRSPFAAEHLGPDIRQRRLVIAVAVGRIVHSPENQRERQYTGNDRKRAVRFRPAVARHLLHALARLHRALERPHLVSLLCLAQDTEDTA